MIYISLMFGVSACNCVDWLLSLEWGRWSRGIGYLDGVVEALKVSEQDIIKE